MEEAPKSAEAQESKGKHRAKSAASGGWSWVKSNRAGQALLATVASAVVAALAVAGIVVPLHEVERKVGVQPSRFDAALDHLEAVDSALAAIQMADPVGAVNALAPQVKELAGQVADIRTSLGPSTSAVTSTVTTGVPLVLTTATPVSTPNVMGRLEAAETKLGALSSGLATESETVVSLSTAVAAIRGDLAAARDELAAVRALAQAAKTAADEGKAAAAAAIAAAAAAQAAADEANRLRPHAYGPPNVTLAAANGRATLLSFTLSPGKHVVSFYSNQNPGNCENGGHFIVDADGKDIAWATNGDEGPTAATFGLTGILDAGTGGAFRLQAATSLASCTVSNLWVRTQELG